MRIGFVGLDNMGQEMACNLVRAGHRLTVYNRTRSRGEPLARMGATIAGSPSKAAEGQEVAITMLADDHAVKSVVLGRGGVTEGLPQRALHISTSTISPYLSQRLVAAHREHGQQYAAAPVFGRPEAAAEGKLFIVAAGPKDAPGESKTAIRSFGATYV